MTQFLRLDLGPMNLIWTPGELAKYSGALYLGNIPNGIALGKTFHKRFWAILNCTDDPELDHLNAEPGFIVKRLNQWDGERYPDDKIAEGIKFIDEHMRTGSAVLVCCHAGMSRSPGMVLAYLLSLGYNYFESMNIIVKARDFIKIHPNIESSIRDYFKKDTR